MNHSQQNHLPYRQIHLDFHTSELIGPIGGEFDKKQFQDMLKLGHVNSINIFAKCHHGWSYHNSDIPECEIHPKLGFDLLQAMIEACHEIDVKCPVYISAGLDEKIAVRRPEWQRRFADNTTTWVKDIMSPGYHELCMNSGYLDYLKAQVQYVTKNYDCDGIWLDIVGERECYCHNCIAIAKEKGLDPTCESDMHLLGRDTYKKYTDTINGAIREIKPDMLIFHNGGHIKQGRKDLEDVNSHLEIESLPTGGWGYDNLPLSARYLQQGEKEYLSMTGKFHTTWGEFGGFKHPNALRYECALAVATGAKCSVGDQMHPLGMLEETTYDSIGKAFSEIEAIEKYCADTTNVAEIAFVSAEASDSFGLVDEANKELINTANSGALRILQEGQYLFDIIDSSMDLSKYRLVVLPDCIGVDEKFAKKINEYIANGGKIFATGDSGLKGDKFEIDLGVSYEGKDEYLPSYCRTDYDIKDLKATAFVMASRANLFNVTDDSVTIKAYNEASYFNRQPFAFSSHQHTPNNKDAEKRAGIAISEKGAYCGWFIFSEYVQKGEITSKYLILDIIDELLGDKMLTTTLPVPSVVTLRKKSDTATVMPSASIIHALYAPIFKRGDVEVIEDIPLLADTQFVLTTNEKVTSVKVLPSESSIDFTQEGDTLKFTLPTLECHAMVAIESK